ncbi:hypothetical protein AX17_002068 [Amanita inopinata Kibby_2008]|nr:hypothetical protein AX17_002068 [Amanita inopinata Kibby_2008]
MEQRVKQLEQELESLKRARLDAEHRAEQADRALSRQMDAELEFEPEWMKIAEEDSVVTVQRIALSSMLVTYGAGLDIRSIVCGFDTCFVEIKNLPLDVTPKEIEALFTLHGVRERSFRITGTQLYGDGTVKATAIAHTDAGRRVANKLDGTKFRDNPIEFSVIGCNAPWLPLPTERQPIGSNVLTLAWEVGHMAALLSYHDPRAAQNALQQVMKDGYDGHKPHAEIISSGQGRPTQVSITGLPAGVTPFKLNVHGNAHAVIIQPDKHGPLSLLQGLAEKLRQSDGFKQAGLNSPSPGSPHCIVNASFDTWLSAKQAHASLIGKRLKPEFPMIRCHLPLSKPVKYAVYIPLEPFYTHNWDVISDQPLPSSYQFVSSTTRLLSQIKPQIRVEKLFPERGEDWSYWRWASSPSTTSFFYRTQTHLGLSLVELCWMTRTLKLFAEDRVALDTALQLIKDSVKRSSLPERVVTADRCLIRTLQAAGGLPALKARFGNEAVSLDITPSHCMLKHRETSSLRQLLTRQIDQVEDYAVSRELAEPELTCPICLDEPTMTESGEKTIPPIQLTCGHAYCSDCLKQYLITTPERPGDQFPIKCTGNAENTGNENRCQLPIPIPIIQSALSSKEFDTLAEKAITSYVDRHTEEYKYCIVPDCKQVYRARNEKDKEKGKEKEKEKDGDATRTQFLPCPTCIELLCTSCLKNAHPGLSCDDKRILDNPHEQEALNDEWAMHNSAKRCPSCQVWIQKREGCNHVICRCGAHICWICLACFMGANGSRDTYAHLRAEHPTGLLQLVGADGAALYADLLGGEGAAADYVGDYILQDRLLAQMLQRQEMRRVGQAV